MNGLDLLLMVLAVVAAIGGWRLGFLRRAAAWLGAGAGLALAIVVAPEVLGRLSLRSDLAVVVVVTALLVLFASLGQALGAAVGLRIRREVDSPAGRTVDAVGGTLLGGLGVALLAWLVVPVMADASGWPAASTRGSTFAELVTTHLPAPPPQIQDLERQLVGGAAPQLFARLQPAPELPEAPADSPVSQALLDATAPSAVRLRSEACGMLQSGSGFFVDEGVVATNAHVVAGSDRVELRSADGATGTGRVVAFDPAVDLALLRTDLRRAPLELAEPEVGERGLVLGFPGGGPFAPSPFEVGQLLEARGYDIYDRNTVERRIVALASALEPGDSGSAVLRTDGRVIAVAVAIAPDRSGVAYALHSDQLRALLPLAGERTVGTGRCAA